MVDLSVKIGNKRFQNPIFAASGSYGHAKELFDVAPPNLFGAITIKSLLNVENVGNPAPRLYPLPDGMFNSIGLPGPGVDLWFENNYSFVQKKYKKINAKLIFAIWGKSEEDFYIATTKFVENIKKYSNDYECIYGYEINLSCPNTHATNSIFAHDAKLVHKIISTCKKIIDDANLDILIFAKLSPNLPSIVEVAVSAIDAKSDALVISNTIAGVITKNSRSVLGNAIGGLSGPQIKPVITRHIKDVVAHYEQENKPVNIIACGGVFNANDVIEYLLAGAKCVGMATSIFYRPRLVENIVSDLARICTLENVENLNMLIEKIKESL